MDQPQTGKAGLTQEERLQSLGEVLAAKRAAAQTDRKESGIEEVWLKCEEAYLGIDDENRNEWAKAKWAKPTSMNGPVTAEEDRRDPYRSNAFVRLTARYVDCGAAKLQEILLPADDKIFSLSATPVPDRLSQIAQQAPQPMAAQIPPVAVPGAPPGMPQPQGIVPPGMPPGMPPAKKPETPEEKAEKRISDWLIEGKYPREARKAIHDAARLGTGIIKGPFSDIRVSRALNVQGDVAELVLKNTLVPGLKWIDPWNLFPDGTCGENIHDGNHLFERDFLSPRALKALKKMPGYMPEQIDKVLKEGPGKSYLDDANPNERRHEKRYDVWYYYGVLDREDMAACRSVGVDTLKEDQTDVYAIATLINDTVIRAVINPQDSGEYPFRVVNWQRRAGHWAGIGVAEQCDMPQRTVNASTRAMMNNGGRSAGSQIVIDNAAITPADKNWVITPDKIWYKTGDAIVDDVRKAFMAVQFPNMTPQLMSIIEYGFRLAEESTNIPLITQGQSGGTTPDTLGATQLQNNNANQLLRAVGAAWDDDITEPLVQGFYEWLLLDPSVPAEEKGDFQIHVHGSELIERNIQQQEIIQIMQMAANPAFEIDPAKASDELLKSWRFDPRAFKLDDEKKAEMASRPPPEAPQVTVAKIRAQTDMERAKMDTDRDNVYAKAELDRTRVEAMSRREELMLKREIAYLDAQVKKGIEVDSNKVKLADTAAKLRVQKELAFVGHAHQAMMKPPTEPPGRAQPGRSFEQ